jgi:NADPH:quinone reductase-like Zn-dependent oxidoreductase
MKAVLLTGHGGLEKLEYREDVPTPEPAEDEVLIAVGAAGINNTDIWTREGAYGTEGDPATTSVWRRGSTMRFPRIQGADIVGRVVGVGEGVSDSRIGERVIVDNALYSGGEEGLVEGGRWEAYRRGRRCGRRRRVGGRSERSAPYGPLRNCRGDRGSVGAD